MTNTDLVTTLEAAQMLRVSVPTVNRLARAGKLTEVFKLPGLRGGRVFNRADVQALGAQEAQSA